MKIITFAVARGALTTRGYREKSAPDKCVKRYLHYKAGRGGTRKNVFGIINIINVYAVCGEKSVRFPW